MEADVSPRTWRRATWAWKLFQAQRAEAKGNFALALRLLDEAAGIKALWTPERVQRALLLLQNEQVSDAQRAFADIWKELEGSVNPDQQYLRRYCRAMLEMIRGEASALSHVGREARAIPCKPRLRQRFPLLDDED